MSRRFASDQVTYTSLHKYLAGVLCGVDCAYPSQEPGRAAVVLTMESGGFSVSERFSPAAALQLAEALRRAAERAQCIAGANPQAAGKGGAA